VAVVSDGTSDECSLLIYCLTLQKQKRCNFRLRQLQLLYLYLCYASNLFGVESRQRLSTTFWYCLRLLSLPAVFSKFGLRAWSSIFGICA